MTLSILVITPAFPPIQGSQTQRMVALTQSLANAGFNVAVLCTEILITHPGYNENTIGLIDSRIKVFRAPVGFMHKKAYTKYTELSDIKYGKQEAKKEKVLKSRVYSLLNRIKVSIMFPDTMIDWYKSTINYVRENHIIEKIKPNFILSCSMPNTCHLIGYKISKENGIPLLMDYSDPWVYISGYKHGKVRFILEKRLEEKILKHSILASFTTKGAEELYISKFSLDRNKTITAMTGFDKEIVQKYSTYSSIAHNGIILTYGGALQEGVRDPRPFFEALQNMKTESVRVMIRTDNCERIRKMVQACSCDDIVHIDGYIPFDQYYEEMLDSDILVFFGNSTSDQLPGKIFNYISTGKPILYISNVEEGGRDQALNIVRDYGFCVIVNNDSNEIYRGIHDAIRILKEKPIDLNKKIEKYTTEKQMESLVRKIEESS